MKKLISFIDKYYWRVFITLILIITLSVLSVPLLEGVMSEAIALSILIPSVVLMVPLAVFSPKRYDKLYLIFLGLFIIGFMMKKFHLIGAGIVLVFSTGVIVFMLIGQIIVSLRVKKNLFLKIIGAFASLILALGYAGTIFKTQHWPGANFMLNIALPSFLIGSFILVIGIQMTDFAAWQEQHRKFLTRNVLLPWFFIFLLGSFSMLFPEVFHARLDEVTHWGLKDYQLPE